MESLWISVVVLLGLVAGFAAGYALGLFRGRASAKSDDTLPELERLRAGLVAETTRKESLEGRMSELQLQRDELLSEKNREAEEIGKLKSEKTALENRLAEQREEVNRMQETFRQEFHLLANRIFDEKSEKFNTQSKASIAQILEPLQQKIGEFEKKVENTHRENIRETATLKEEIRTLKETSKRMSEDAENLVKALKNDSKVQGNWGEMILERLLEGSGLRRDSEYFLQPSFTIEDGRRLQPDVLVQLPDNKFVVIDSKVSLVHYERYANSETDDERKALLRQHVQSVRNHMRSLDGKNYQDLSQGRNLDFILMFVPVEPAYITALQSEPGLYNEAYERQIIMVSPSILMASLRIIASIWKREYQNKNAQEIAERGRLLYEKFVGFTEDMLKIGDHLGRTQTTYDNAMKKLQLGSGSLIRQAELLESLGVQSRKPIDERLRTADLKEGPTE